MNKTHADLTKLATGASVSLIGKFIGRALHVIGQVVLARLLGPRDLGLYAIVWTLLRMAGLLAPLGLDQGVIHYASHYRHDGSSRLKGALFQSIGLAVFSGLIIGGSLYITAPWLAEQVFREPDLVSVIRWFSPAFCLYSALKVTSAATRASQQMRFAVYAEEIAQPLTNLLLILFLYSLGWKLLGAVLATMSSFGIAFALSLRYVSHIFPEIFSPKIDATGVIRELMAFSLPVSLAGAFSKLVVWVDRLLVGYFLSAEEVGVYQAVSQLSVLFSIILSAFGSIFAPMIADLYHRKKEERLQELFRVSTKWTLYLSLPLSMVICFAPSDLITVIFGPEYNSGAIPLVILTIGQLIGAGTGTVGLLLIMSGKPGYWLWATATMLFANILLNALLVPKLHLLGAALATTCALGGMSTIGLFFVRRHLGMWPYDKRYLKLLFATIFVAGVLFLLRFVKIDLPMLTLLSVLGVSVVVFGTTLILLGLDAEEKQLIDLAWTRLWGRVGGNS